MTEHGETATQDTPLTAGDLYRFLADLPADTVIGARIDGDPQGHSVLPGEGYNPRENILWFRIRGADDGSSGGDA